MSEDISDANEATQGGGIAPRTFTKTPLFIAGQALRYQRQTLIRDIEERVGRILICFVCGARAEIDRDDTAGFVDLLHNVHAGDEIDLMLHSGGGDVDAAEKLIRLVRAKVGEQAKVRIVIPDFAKSAATLMALGADVLVMSDSSELGAIDPQIRLNDGRGNAIGHSVLVYLRAYEDLAKALRADRDDPVAQLMFDKFEPAIVKKFEGIRDRTRNVAENLLKRRGRNYSKIASDLMDIDRWQSHNQMIGVEEAQGLGLEVEVLGADDPVWQLYWHLYCLLSLTVQPEQKIFESNYVSLLI